MAPLPPSLLAQRRRGRQGQSTQATTTKGKKARERARACAKAVSTVCTTLEEVHVMVGTTASARALVTRLVLMYTTCSESGVRDASERYDA